MTAEATRRIGLSLVVLFAAAAWMTVWADSFTEMPEAEAQKISALFATGDVLIYYCPDCSRSAGTFQVYKVNGFKLAKKNVARGNISVVLYRDVFLRANAQKDGESLRLHDPKCIMPEMPPDVRSPCHHNPLDPGCEQRLSLNYGFYRTQGGHFWQAFGTQVAGNHPLPVRSFSLGEADMGKISACLRSFEQAAQKLK
jgi:hypothetical protein